MPTSPGGLRGWPLLAQIALLVALAALNFRMAWGLLQHRPLLAIPNATIGVLVAAVLWLAWQDSLRP
jgi:hypothetical protein